MNGALMCLKQNLPRGPSPFIIIMSIWIPCDMCFSWLWWAAAPVCGHWGLHIKQVISKPVVESEFNRAWSAVLGGGGLSAYWYHCSARFMATVVVSPSHSVSLFCPVQDVGKRRENAASIKKSKPPILSSSLSRSLHPSIISADTHSCTSWPNIYRHTDTWCTFRVFVYACVYGQDNHQLAGPTSSWQTTSLSLFSTLSLCLLPSQ